MTNIRNPGEVRVHFVESNSQVFLLRQIAGSLASGVSGCLSVQPRCPAYGGDWFGGLGRAWYDSSQSDAGRVELIARSIQRPITYSLERGRPGSVIDTLKAAFVFDRLYGAFLYDTEGHLLVQAGEGNPETLTNTRLAEIVIRGFSRGGSGGGYGDDEVFSCFVPLRSSEGQRIGLLQVTRSKAEMREALGRIQKRLLGGYLLICLLFILLLVYIHELFFARPLIALQRTIARIEGGSHSDRAPVSGPSEWTELSQRFNHMLDAIEMREKELLKKDIEERKLKDRLRDSEKLATIGEMAASIGHEIGTPLSTVDGIAQRTLRKAPKGPASQGLQSIREQILRIEDFVRHLLALGRGHGGQSATDLLAAARLAILDTDFGGGERITAQWPEKSEAILVHSDSLRLRIALRNLLDNALQSQPDSRVQVSVERIGNRAVCRIDDDGPGVPPDERQHIFEPFVTHRSDGTGIGRV